MLGSLVPLLALSLFLTHAGAGRSHDAATCSAALAVDTSANGGSAHQDMISRAIALFAVGPPRSHARLVAYEYQTYGGREYVEFATLSGKGNRIPVLPFGITMFPFKGDVYGALHGAARTAKVQQRTMMPPFDTLRPTTKVTHRDCPRRTV